MRSSTLIRTTIAAAGLGVGLLTAAPAGAASAALDARPDGAAAAPQLQTVTPEAASPIIIRFENDPPGGKPNGFRSADSPLVSFTDTLGADLSVGDFGAQSNGQALGVFGDDNSAVVLQLARPTNRVALSYGDDDPGFTNPGDLAVLRAFRNGSPVGQTTQVLNRNDIMDQRIVFEAKLFDRVVFSFVTTTPNPPTELIDDIQLNPLCDVAGTEGNDNLSGTAADEVICGGAGNDIVSGGGGNDNILGGAGNDTVNGGPGNDAIFGGPGDDIAVGGPGNDVLDTSTGRDVLDGSVGVDRCLGGPQVDTFRNCEVVTGRP